MPVIKTTIKIESTTVFPKSFSISKVITESINGKYVSFQLNKIQPSDSEAIIAINDAAGKSGVIYLYVQANAANQSAVLLSMKNGSSGLSTDFSKILPGDVLFIPLYAEDENGITITAKNLSSEKSAAITHFYASRD